MGRDGLRVGTAKANGEIAGVREAYSGPWLSLIACGVFAPQTQKLVLEIGRTLTLEATLGLAGLAEQVSVESRAPLLQMRTAEISDVIENREVVQLPLNGRNLMALAQLSDSVVTPPGGTRGEALQQAGPLPNVGVSQAATALGRHVAACLWESLNHGRRVGVFAQ